jgi:hypothetical protein
MGTNIYQRKKREKERDYIRGNSSSLLSLSLAKPK